MKIGVNDYRTCGTFSGGRSRLTWNDEDFENNQVYFWTRKRRGGDLEYDWLSLTNVLKQTLLWWKNRPIKVRRFWISCHQIPDSCDALFVWLFGGVILAILRHKSPNTTALNIKKIGLEKVVRDALEDLSQQKGRILEFRPRQVDDGIISSQKEKAVSGDVNS